MGFLDKARKMAEQAQSKLDEVQKQFSESQGSGAGSQEPAVEYDQHGRPIRNEPPAAEPVGPPPAAPTPPHGDPVAPRPTIKDEPRSEDDPYAPPKLTGGDPLAG